jgi:hypothetical protein
MRRWGLLCTRPTRLVGFFIVLAQCNHSPRIDMSPHSDTFSWFRANQSLLFHLNTACLTEKQQIPILQSLVLPDQGSNPWTTALEASMLIITPPMRLSKQEPKWLQIGNCIKNTNSKIFTSCYSIKFYILWMHYNSWYTNFRGFPG